jgi:hypothetical protein
LSIASIFDRMAPPPSPSKITCHASNYLFFSATLSPSIVSSTPIIQYHNIWLLCSISFCPSISPKWCEFYSDELLPETKKFCKKVTSKLDAFGLYLPSRMSAMLSPELLEKGMKLGSGISSSMAAETKSGEEEDDKDDGTVEEEVDALPSDGECRLVTTPPSNHNLPHTWKSGGEGQTQLYLGVYVNKHSVFSSKSLFTRLQGGQTLCVIACYSRKRSGKFASFSLVIATQNLFTYTLLLDRPNHPTISGKFRNEDDDAT